MDAIIIPVGGGGLLAGIAKAMKTMKPSVKIIVSDRQLETKIINLGIRNDISNRV